METAVDWIIPSIIVLAGAISGFRAKWSNDEAETALAVFMICHVLLALFPAELLETGKIFVWADIEGYARLAFNFPDFAPAMVNIGISWILMWALIYVVGAVIDLKKELLP